MIFINVKKGTFEEGTKKLKDMSAVGHHGNGDYAVDIKTMDDFEDAIPYIRESIKINKK
jgi:predicted transport protein